MLTQTVTTVWRTELGTTLLIGFFDTTVGSAYFRYLSIHQFASTARTRQVPRQYGRAGAQFAFKKLIILAGLRKLGDSIRTEVKHMPILDDIMDHDVIGPAIREGMQKGREEGREEGERTTLRKLIAKRFGTLPASVDERLTSMSKAELEELSTRLFDAKSIEELFSR